MHFCAIACLFFSLSLFISVWLLLFRYSMLFFSEFSIDHGLRTFWSHIKTLALAKAKRQEKQNHGAWSRNNQAKTKYTHFINNKQSTLVLYWNKTNKLKIIRTGCSKHKKKQYIHKKCKFFCWIFKFLKVFAPISNFPLDFFHRMCVYVCVCIYVCAPHKYQHNQHL